MIYQHWIGKLKIEMKGNDLSESIVDMWLPEEPESVGEKIGQDEWENATVFPKLLRGRAKVGPFRATVTLNAGFSGFVEYWRDINRTSG